MSLKATGKSPTSQFLNYPQVPAPRQPPETLSLILCVLSASSQAHVQFAEAGVRGRLWFHVCRTPPAAEAPQIFGCRLKQTLSWKRREEGWSNSKGGKETRTFLLLFLKRTPVKTPHSKLFKFENEIVISCCHYPKSLSAGRTDCRQSSSVLCQKSCLGRRAYLWCVSKVVWGLGFACKKRAIRTKKINKIKTVVHLSTAFVFTFPFHLDSLARQEDMGTSLSFPLIGIELFWF